MFCLIAKTVKYFLVTPFSLLKPGRSPGRSPMRSPGMQRTASAGQDRTNSEIAKEYEEFYLQYWKSHRLHPPTVYTQHLNAALLDIQNGIRERDDLRKELEEEKANRAVLASLRVQLLAAQVRTRLNNNE